MNTGDIDAAMMVKSTDAETATSGGKALRLNTFQARQAIDLAALGLAALPAGASVISVHRGTPPGGRKYRRLDGGRCLRPCSTFHVRRRLSYRFVGSPPQALYLFDDFRPRATRMSRVHCRLRVVFQNELCKLCRVAPFDLCDDLQRKINSSRYTAAGDAVPVDADPFIARLDTQGYEWFVERPVGSGAVALQQPRHCEKHRACACGGDIGGSLSGPSNKVQKFLVFHDLRGSRATSDKQHVQIVRNVMHCNRRVQGDPHIRRNRVHGFPDDVCFGMKAKCSLWPCQVLQRKAWKDHHTYLQLAVFNFLTRFIRHRFSPFVGLDYSIALPDNMREWQE